MRLSISGSSKHQFSFCDRRLILIFCQQNISHDSAHTPGWSRALDRRKPVELICDELAFSNILTLTALFCVQSRDSARDPPAHEVLRSEVAGFSFLAAGSLAISGCCGIFINRHPQSSIRTIQFLNSWISRQLDICMNFQGSSEDTITSYKLGDSR